MTYPKVIAFLIPGPSCYGNIILLLSKSVMWLFLIMIWLFCRVPWWPSGACQLYPRYVKPLTAPCTNTGTTARRNQPQGCAHWCRDQGDVKGFVFHPLPRSRIFCGCCSLAQLPTGQDGTWPFTPADGKCFSRWSTRPPIHGWTHPIAPCRKWLGLCLLWLIQSIPAPQQGSGRVGGSLQEEIV